MKALFLLAILFLSGCGQSLGANQTEDEVIAQLEIDLKTEQTVWKQTHDKYKQKLKEKKLPYDIEFKVDEYVAPSGVGYQANIKRSNGSTKSFGEGVESAYRSYNWTPASPTSTVSSTI
jgi:hypothetical protein